MKPTSALLLCIPFVIATLGIGVTQDSAATQYSQVQQVFDAKCTQCHAGPHPARGLQLDSWEHLIAGSPHGEAVIPFDAENSLRIELSTTRHGLVGSPAISFLEPRAGRAI